LFEILGNLASPWGLAAFLVGLWATPLRRGAIAGGVTLLVGVATYYAGLLLRGYLLVEVSAVWMVLAAVVGPIMGLSGAAISSRRSRPPLPALVAPAAMLVAEAIFFLVDRRVWRYDLGGEPYRLIDVGVAAALLAGGIVLPSWFVKERLRRIVVSAAVIATGALGALAFDLLKRLIV
jgi:hypothetical protein